MENSKNLWEKSHQQRAEEAFRLIQAVSDRVLFSRQAYQAVRQAQDVIEEVLGNLEEDAAYYEKRPESLL